MATEPMPKVMLLEKLRAEHDVLEAVLAPLFEAQMTTGGVTERWSIKDVRPHVNAWERCVLDRLQAVLHGAEPAFIVDAATDEEMVQVNVQFL